jgi:hypothetical protein
MSASAHNSLRDPKPLGKTGIYASYYNINYKKEEWKENKHLPSSCYVSCSSLMIFFLKSSA